ncbi:MAG: hypothetical protein Q8T04_13985 [Bacteroidota bacterium]|nr:hypothetical protein [Bacteroidota bacterium]
MEKKDFLLESKVKKIEGSFNEKGWLTIYERDDIKECGSRIFCCLIDKEQKQVYNQDHIPPIWMGRGGKPVVYGDNTYKTYEKDGLEPFLFCRNFPTINTPDFYIDVSEEFVLYFNLYEQGINKQERKYCFVDEVGQLIDVIIIRHDKVLISLKHLKEYITIREMNFVISFDFSITIAKCPDEWKIEMKDEIKKTENFIYRHLIRNEFNYVQSDILGNVFIDSNPNKTTHFNDEETESVKFIVGYDDAGNEIQIEPSRSKENFHKRTYFRREVLEKYYNDPSCKVDSFIVSTKTFSVKIDNSVDDYIPVFLGYLSALPQRELYHWKIHNIPPSNGMDLSSSYKECMINGNFVDYPERVDHYFKHRYHEFNEKWEKKFGWKFYKPLADEDKFRFKSLHLPATNNIISFCDQILNLSIITIDRLNEAEIEKKLKKMPKNKALEDFLVEISKNDINIPPDINIQLKVERGLAKLERFIKENGHNFSDMNEEFLRRLWDLRSGLLAHGFSNSNNKCKKAIEYFGIKDNNYIEVAKSIFENAIKTMDILERNFI